MLTNNTLSTVKPLIKRRNFVLPFHRINISYIRSLLVLLLLLIWSMSISQAQTTIWMEDFQGLAEGTIVDNGPTVWLRYLSNFDFTDADYRCFEVYRDTLQGRDTEGKGIWYSQ